MDNSRGVLLDKRYIVGLNNSSKEGSAGEQEGGQ